MDIIKDITDFIFISSEPKNADLIFIPGTSYPEPTEKAAELMLKGISPYVLPAGRYSVKKGYFDKPKLRAEIYNGSYETEWEFMQDILTKAGVSSDKILREDQSENTFENAFNSKRIVEESKLNLKKAIICCQAFHARRCFMYYKWAFPEVEFLVCPVETQGISKDNWFKTSYGIERVMGELARCGIQLKDAIEELSKNPNL